MTRERFAVMSFMSCRVAVCRSVREVRSRAALRLPPPCPQPIAAMPAGPFAICDTLMSAARLYADAAEAERQMDMQSADASRPALISASPSSSAPRCDTSKLFSLIVMPPLIALLIYLLFSINIAPYDRLMSLFATFVMTQVPILLFRHDAGAARYRPVSSFSRRHEFPPHDKGSASSASILRRRH